MKRKEKNVSDLFASGATYVYLILMLGIFPMFYKGTLFDISIAKRDFFLIVTGIYLCILVIPFINEVICCIKGKKYIEGTASDLFAVLFVITVILSTVLSTNREGALWGFGSQKYGMVVLLLCLLMYFAVKKYAVYDSILIWVYLIGSGLIYLCGITLTCQIDILNMQKGIMEAQKAIFVSPLGNINYNASYISLMLPAAMVMYLLCREKFTKNVLAVYLYLGFLDAICIRADSILAVLGVIFPVLMYFALENETWLMRFFVLIQIFVFANLTVYVLRWILKSHIYVFSGLGAYLLKPQTLILEIMICCILLWFQKKKKRPAKEKLEKLQKMYGIVFAAAIVLGIILMILVNFCFRDQAAGTVFGKLLITDETGSGRGYIWMRTLQVFIKVPVRQKLFGVGLSCFYNFIYPYYGSDMLEKWHVVFYDPHNVFLQVLAETGIVGVIGYFGMIFSTVISAIKKRKNQEMQIAVIVTFIALLVQGLVNGDTIFVIPLIFVVLGLSYSHPREEEVK